jgi:pimeloyl-ACP methyl ester carboxylesterase
MRVPNEVADGLPVVLVPGLNCSARLYARQIPAQWRFGPVTVADHTRGDTIAAIASQILAAAPPRFALAGLSMGGYIAFEIMRQAAERVVRLALLDTGARADSPEQTQRRQALIEMAKTGRFARAAEDAFRFYVHPARHHDAALKALVIAMAAENGVDAYLRQQHAIIGRPDSRPGLAAISCPTLVLVGEQDQGTPLALSQEIAAAISGSRLVVIAECGHLSTMERPDAVTEALVEWMRG